jgi:hypothetical protein
LSLHSSSLVFLELSLGELAWVAACLLGLPA